MSENYDNELLMLIQETLKAYDEADKQFDKIEEFCQNISDDQSRIDSILSDLYHEIENDDLTDEQMITFGKEVKKYRKIRRKMDNANIIRNVFDKHKSKLPIREQRPFFRNSVKQVLQDLNKAYKNRVLTDEDIKNLKNSSKNEEIKYSSKIDLNELKKELASGKTQSEIAIKFGCSQPKINYWIKKIKEEGNINENINK